MLTFPVRHDFAALLRGNSMNIIGVTGGTGGGKTTVTNILKSFGACIVVADVVARQVVASGMPA